MESPFDRAPQLGVAAAALGGCEQYEPALVLAHEHRIALVRIGAERDPPGREEQREIRRLSSRHGDILDRLPVLLELERPAGKTCISQESDALHSNERAAARSSLPSERTMKR